MASNFRLTDCSPSCCTIVHGSTGGGGQGPAGPQGAQGSMGQSGIQGPTGLQGLQGLRGITGPTGTKGLDGADGSISSQAFQYVFDSIIGMAESVPSGNLRLNQANYHAYTTQIALSHIDAQSKEIKDFLQTIDDSTSQLKGIMKITKADDESVFIIIGVTEAPRPVAGLRTSHQVVEGVGTKECIPTGAFF